LGTEAAISGDTHNREVIVFGLLVPVNKSSYAITVYKIIKTNLQVPVQYS
jgi:hypothetical protein